MKCVVRGREKTEGGYNGRFSKKELTNTHKA